MLSYTCVFSKHVALIEEAFSFFFLPEKFLIISPRNPIALYILSTVLSLSFSSCAYHMVSHLFVYKGAPPGERFLNDLAEYLTQSWWINVQRNASILGIFMHSSLTKSYLSLNMRPNPVSRSFPIFQSSIHSRSSQFLVGPYYLH